MNNEAPKDYNQSPGQIKSLHRLPKTKCALLLKLLAASCVMDRVGAATPFITAAGSSPTTCECSQAINSAVNSAVTKLRAEFEAELQQVRILGIFFRVPCLQIGLARGCARTAPRENRRVSGLA